MKFSLRIPLVIGAVVLVTALCMGIISLQISTGILETTILNAMGDQNRSNAKLLSAALNGQLDVVYKLANRQLTQAMEVDAVKPRA